MGKLEKTDKTGKTVEAWWALLFAEGSLGQYAIRWGWPVIGGAIGAWVASATDWISSYGVAGWAATIMLGALGTVWIAVGIDHFRSKRSREVESSVAPELDYQPETLDRLTSLTEGEVKALVEARLEEFLATKLRGEFITNAQHHAYDEKVAYLADKVKDARIVANSAIELIDKRSNDATIDINSLEAQISDLKRDWQVWTNQHCRSQDQRFDWVDSGFKAILHREQMTFHAEMIEELGAKLLRVRNGEPIENWGEWTTQQNRWLSGISAWLGFAEKYRVGCRARILTVDPDTLLGEWPEPDSAFPSTDAMMAYRRVAVTLSQFRLEQQAADDAVKIAAYSSPSKKGPLGG